MRQTALLEVPPPPLEIPASGAMETAAVTRYLPDEMTVEVTAAAPGLLVLGEIYDPGWQVSVNGVATPLLAANHALRAVAIPAGSSTVELGYAFAMLGLGVLVTLLTVALIAGALVGGRRLSRGVRNAPLSAGETFGPCSPGKRNLRR